MKPAIRYTVFAIGLLVLFEGTYVGVSVLRGAKVGDLPIAGGPGRSTATTRGGESTKANATTGTSTSADAASGATAPASGAGDAPPLRASALDAFLLPSPFSAQELASIEQRLRDREADVEKRLEHVARRERALDERERAVASRADELRALLAELESSDTSGKARARSDGAASAGSDPKAWRDVARFFADGDAGAAAKRLAAYDPADAARILRELDEERSNEIVQALPADRAKSVLDAYRDAPRSSAGEEPSKSGGP